MVDFPLACYVFGGGYPPGNEKTYPTVHGKRKIIDSEMPAGRGYVSSQEGIKMLFGCVFLT